MAGANWNNGVMAPYRSPLLDDLAGRADALVDEGLFKNERVIASPQSAHIRSRRRHRGAQPLRQQLPRPGRPPGAGRGGPNGARHVTATAWRRCGSSAARRRSTSKLEERISARSSAPRTRSSTRRASTPTAGCSRRSSTSRTASSPTPSTTPRSSTASGSARPSGSATPTTTWPSSSSGSSEAAGARYRLIATDGVFSMDGVIADLAAICDLAERYDAHGDGRRLARRRLRRSGRPRHARTLRSRPTGSTSSPARSARRSAAPPAATPAAARRSSTGCASARARTCSATRWRR